jgi:hypothetical protein
MAEAFIDQVTLFILNRLLRDILMPLTLKLKPYLPSPFCDQGKMETSQIISLGRKMQEQTPE